MVRARALEELERGEAAETPVVELRRARFGGWLREGEKEEASPAAAEAEEVRRPCSSCMELMRGREPLVGGSALRSESDICVWDPERWSGNS